MLKGDVVYGEGEVGEVRWVECSVEGFRGVRYEGVVVKVGDEVVNVVLGMLLESGDIGGRYDEGGVVSVGVEVGKCHCGVDVVDVEEEEGGGES